MTKSLQIALYMDMDQAHQRGIASGIIQYAGRQGNWRLFGAYWPMYEIQDLGAWEGNGIIAAIETAEDIHKVLQTGLPIVDVSGGQEHPDITRIVNDSVLTGEIAGRHLLDNGYDRFAFVGCSDMMWSQQRYEGLEKVTRSRRIGDIAVFGRPKKWWRSPEFSTELAQFLAKQKRPFSIMAANDITGMNVVGSCRLAGLRIPEDAAIVSVDNEVLLCELSTPPLSSIPFDRHKIGFRAAKHLDAMMSGTCERMPPMLIPPLPLVERESSARRSVSDQLVSQALDFIRKNATNGVTPLDVVRHSLVSRRNLEQRFKKQVGHSLLAEIHRTRISYAKKLLVREDNMPISRIASMSGFSSANRFLAIFERYESRSAREYRKTNIIL